MCDTLVAVSSATADGSVIFGKNSDREPNEAQELILFPAAGHPEDSTVRCTYVEVPQAPETFAVLLARPFWIWGAEMGANSQGVVIGNEALFTKVPHEKGPGLIGMDFIRLALERGATARQALDVIVSLLEAHGQGGNCGYAHPLFYDNSFILADPAEAWVLETAGKQWAAQRVVDVRSISNAITIGREWDLASNDLVDYALDQGWCKSRDDFDFGACYSDFLYTRFSDSRKRCARSGYLLRASNGQITAEGMMSYLRDHMPSSDNRWTPGASLVDWDVCAHVGFGPVRSSQTVGSQVSHLTPGLQTHWLTGTAAPCTSIFKPVWMDAGLPEDGLHPQASYDETALWWRHESLHREVVRDYSARMSLYKEERDALEADFRECAVEAAGLPAEERLDVTRSCFERADQAEAGWLESVRSFPIQKGESRFYAFAWRGFNRAAKMPLAVSG